MSDSIINKFRKRQQDTLADEIRLQRWSIILLLAMIAQEEKRLQDSDVAVEQDDGRAFWAHLQ